MSLHAPKLDDRSFNDLVEEAKRRIAARCPGWTDFNPSDPGMMLVELMAWMTDTVLYRLNRVPELNYVKFLELIGVRLQPPRPARTWVFFEAQQKTNEETLALIPEGTRVSTRPKEHPPVTFVTCKDLNLTACNIAATACRFRGASHPGAEILEMEVSHAFEKPVAAGVPMFGPDFGIGAPHRLYLGDAELAEFLGKWTTFRVQVDLEKPASAPLWLQLETWDGENWQNVFFDSDDTMGLSASGPILFRKLSSMKKGPFKKVLPEQVTTSSLKADADALWLRTRVVGTSSENMPIVRRIKWQIEVEEHSLRPQKVLAEMPPPEKLSDKVPHPPNVTLVALEIGTEFFPFGLKAGQGSVFYIQSPIFQRADAYITIQFNVKSELKPEEQQIEIHWEYSAGADGWKKLGTSKPVGVSDSPHHLKDDSQAFTKAGAGKIQFVCPPDVLSTRLGAESGCFIRARVERARFRNDSDAKLIVSAITLAISEKVVRPWACCLSENYSRFENHSSAKPFSPFHFLKEQDPAFYIFFEDRPSSKRGPYRLFMDIVPQTVDTKESNAAERELFAWQYDPQTGWEWAASDSVILPLAPKLQWEYCTGQDKWAPLQTLEDGTEGLAHAGMISFESPPADEWKKSHEFKRSGYWLRLRCIAAEFVMPPRLRWLSLNGVEVEQLTHEETIVGSSKGLPGQCFSLHREILEAPEVWVRQTEEPRDIVEGPGDQKGIEKDAAGFWLQWQEVSTFHQSKPDDLHFTADLEKGEFRFGDGKNGAVPPQGQNNVKVRYRITQGAAGNVGKDTITVIESNLPQAKSVTNPYPAEGGCDREDMAHARERGPWEIKHGNRAVTAEDFTRLAKKASALVGAAACFVDEGIVNLIVVPNDAGQKPQPSQRLLQEVSAYLDDKRLINSRVRVGGPFYETIDIDLDVVLKTRFLNRFGEIKAQIEERLRSFVHPLTGMADRSGWPLGRTLHLSELYYRLEGLDGVDHIERLQMRKCGARDWEASSVKIGPRAYPCFSKNMQIQQSNG